MRNPLKMATEQSTKNQLNQLKKQLADCPRSQFFSFNRRIQQLHKKFSDNSFQKLHQQITTAIEKRQRRLDNLPTPSYPEQLPVSKRREEIIKIIAENQVTILCGETGSGKTTQIPKMCLELGRGVDGLIGHTQPRRLAARSVATRIAEELKSELGTHVGYKVRFHEKQNDNTYIKLMTDGILLAEIRSDRFLSQYDTLIIDEAHERSLNIDFILGYLRWLLPRRKDLKVVITSATIDPERFSKHFNNAPIIEVSGRTFPVDIHYRPLISDDKDDKDRDMIGAVIEAADELHRAGPGDILVFFSGEREIREAAEALRKHQPASTEVLPLFSRLSNAEQNRIFHPSGRHRIILSTNVAETSLTVPGIKYVIDTGVARISRYSWRSRVQRLPIERISQASANQRSGRCGRVSDGIAIRLYSEEDFNARDEFTMPEILRTNLASVILMMSTLNLGKIEAFPFVEPPDSRMVRDGFKLLYEIGAVDGDYKVTPLGRRLAHLPIDTRLARMLLAANDEGALREVLIIVSALAIQDPRERPLDKQQAADEKHSRFKDKKSDFISYLNLWNYYQEKRKELSQGQLRRLCKKEFLSYMRMREWFDTHKQLHLSLQNAKLKESPQEANPDAIHRSLLTGLLGHIGFQEEKREYLGANGRKFYVFPGSGVSKKPPKWVMAAELVETSRLYARTVAAIQPQWVEQLGKHLLRHHYSEPRWEKRPAQVAASERTSFYGITITPQRRINFGPIDTVVSRQIFIRHALVYGEYQCKAPFFLHNLRLVEDIETLEAKSRRRDILVDEDTLYDFYDQHLPQHIYSGKAFEKWRKKVENKNPETLFLTKELLMQRDDSHVDHNLYPDHLTVQGMQLPLRYHFEPGSKDDGVTIRVPFAALGQLKSANFEYLVQGMLEEKIIYFIRSLPKQVRKQFVPAPEYAKACMESIKPSDTAFIPAIAHQLHRMTGNEIDIQILKAINFEDHLLMRFEVVDESGTVIKAGRDLEQLKGITRQKTTEQISKQKTNTIEREGLTSWDFDVLPETVIIDSMGMKIKAWTALVDQGETVAIKLFDSAEKAQQQTGLLKLIMLACSKESRYLKSNLPNIQQHCLHYASTGKCEELKKSIIVNSFRLCFDTDNFNCAKQQDFAAHVEKHRSKLVSQTTDICHQLDTILSFHHKVKKALKGNVNPAWLDALSDITEHSQSLVYVGFLDNLDMHELRQYPRYLKGLQRRIEKLIDNSHKDRGLRLQVQSHWRSYQILMAKDKGNKHLFSPQYKAALQDYRWMLEEFRISLFAQELGTAMPISEKRLKKRWREINEL
ncbi:MAG TPA: ATP-dependent RNA helicase HrpA [Leucothrix mucor]|nr:ATP-dependent RNA helicase HrpA [Leucothrix mucor]